MKNGFTLTHQRQNSSLNSGCRQVIVPKNKNSQVCSKSHSNSCIFFVRVGNVVLIDYLEVDKSITGTTTSLLKAKHPHLDKKYVLFQQDNDPTHYASKSL